MLWLLREPIAFDCQNPARLPTISTQDSVSCQMSRTTSSIFCNLHLLISKRPIKERGDAINQQRLQRREVAVQFVEDGDAVAVNVGQGGSRVSWFAGRIRQVLSG